MQVRECFFRSILFLGERLFRAVYYKWKLPGKWNRFAMDTLSKQCSVSSAKYTDENIIDVAPCTLAVVHGKGMLRTVVGSGVTVCLYDCHRNIAGMNHFLFPRTIDPQKATGRYGNVALIGLFELMLHEGASFPLVAHIGGAAYCDEFEMDAALENIRITWKYLLTKEIIVISQHVGVRHLQEILFDVATGTCTARQFPHAPNA
jgi:chemotaxis protein CheD